VTEIKPKTGLNQSTSSITEILDLGVAAAKQKDWLLVIDYLRLLPLTKTNLADTDWSRTFDLTLEVLAQGDFQQKWEIAKILPLLGKAIIEPLATLLQDETVEVEIRWFICNILGQFADKTVIIALIKLLQQTAETELITIAGETLTKIGTAAIDELVDLLAQPQYRWLAAQSLAYIRTAETITPLLEIVNDPQPEIRTLAIEALGSFHDRRIPPILIAALQDTASAVRLQSAIALGFRPDLGSELNLVAHLQPLLYDLNGEVCRQSAISLGRMKDESASTALFEVLQSELTPVVLKQDIVKALAWSEIELAIDYLQQALVNSNEAIALEIITVLGRISAPDLKLKSAQILVDWYSYRSKGDWSIAPTCSPEIKNAIATSWGELGCNLALEPLQALLTDENRQVQLHAIAAIKKLANRH
jgi:HEAT repeat protein